MMNISLKAFALSFFSKSFWQEASEKKGMALGFIAILTVISAFVSAIVLSNYFEDESEGFFSQLVGQWPTVSFFENKIGIDKSLPYQITFSDGEETESILFISDETIAELSLNDIATWMEENDTRLIIAETAAYAAKSEYELRSFDLSEMAANFNGEYFDKNDLRGFIDAIIAWLPTLLFSFFIIFGFAYRCLQVWIYSVVGLVVNAIIKSNAEWLDIRRIASYAVWPAIAADLATSVMGGEFPLFASIIITIFYLAFGLKAAKK